jgi:hypothetical protein
MAEQPPTTSLARAAAIANQERLADTNVVCVGYGLKFRGGNPTLEVALQYYVHSKLQTDEEIKRAGSTPVPREVEGFRTDVIELHVARASQCPPDKGAPTGGRGGRQENPLVGGTSTTVLSDLHSFPTGYGTLGGICFDAPAGIAGAPGAAMAISNAHVLGLTTGREVIQPWVPIDEYAEAAVKLLLCGSAESFILDTTVPSPLTAVLAAGSAVAFLAAVASDAEDPSRWGQRVGPVPPAGALTRSETVHIKAELPETPFAGRHYRAKTSWAYTRDTTAGTTSEQVTEERENEHVLHGKRVWTERVAYKSGERVRICAEIVTDRGSNADDWFVVAHCFPAKDPERVVKRILRPGPCKPPRKIEPVCFRGFSPPAAPRQTAWFPIREGAFSLDGPQPGRFQGPWPQNQPDALTILQLPNRPLRMHFAPCSRLEVELFHSAEPIQVIGINSAGDVVARAATGTQQGQPEVVVLRAHEIVSAELSGRRGEGFLVGACSFSEAFHGDDDDKERKLRRYTYTGFIDLELRERSDQWGIVLLVQTVDPNPVGTDPALAARDLGGITASANMGSAVGCAVVMLLDHVFNVI